MNTDLYQAIFCYFLRNIVRLAIGCLCNGALAFAVNSEQIIILVDQSKSVDDTNRSEALELAAAIIEGKSWDTTLWKADEKIEQHMVAASEGLAAAKFSCIAAPVGNYTNIANLRQLLRSPEFFDRAKQPMDAWLKGRQFLSADNSTHLTLAQAVVAGSTILKNSTKPYYLIVISDFKEDCFNRPLSDYEPGPYEKLQQQNGKVFDGAMSYNDGSAGEGKYSPSDIAEIKEYKEKIASDQDSLIGKFSYNKTLLAGKRPVELRLFAPSFKRNFTTEISESPIVWNVVDKRPLLAIKHSGFADAELITVKINDKEINSISIRDWQNNDPWEILLDNDHEASWKLGERTSIKLSIDANKLTQEKLTTEFIIQPILPVIKIDNADVQNSTEKKPYLLSSTESLTSAAIDYHLEPNPDYWKATVKASGSSKEGKTSSGSIKIGEFINEAEHESEDDSDDSKKLQLEIEIPHNFPYEKNSIKKTIYLKLPQNQFWVEIGGLKAESIDDKYELPKSRAVTFKATYAGMQNFKWLKPIVIREEDSNNVSDTFEDENNLNFAELKPGEYKVTAKFMFNGKDFKETFTVVVPDRTPWMLIIVGIMAVVSVTLFVYHFLRR
jgi:hypothetical protein